MLFFCKNAHNKLKTQLIDITSKLIHIPKEEKIFFFDIVSLNCFDNQQQHDVSEVYALLCSLANISDKFVIVSYDFPLYNNNWGRVFLRETMAKILEGGICMIMIHNQNTRNTDSMYLTMDDIINLLHLKNDQYNIHNYDNCVIIKIIKNTQYILPKTLPSTLTFYYENYFQLVNVIQQNTQFLQPQDLPYFIYGAHYKGIIMKAIINRYLANKENIALLDMGGGSGFIANELYLENVINDVTVVDHEIAHSKINNMIQQYVKNFGLINTRFINKKIEDYEYNNKFDVIIFIGALLYVDKSIVDQVLMQAWDALNSGGIMIIHENIKHMNYTRDFHCMFSYEDIESRLVRFGKIDYFKNNSFLPIDIMKEKDKNITLFRVLKKNV